jgi:hypothetical protein
MNENEIKISKHKRFVGLILAVIFLAVTAVCFVLLYVTGYYGYFVPIPLCLILGLRYGIGSIYHYFKLRKQKNQGKENKEESGKCRIRISVVLGFLAIAFILSAACAYLIYQVSMLCLIPALGILAIGTWINRAVKHKDPVGYKAIDKTLIFWK